MKASLYSCVFTYLLKGCREAAKWLSPEKEFCCAADAGEKAFFHSFQLVVAPRQDPLLLVVMAGQVHGGRDGSSATLAIYQIICFVSKD